MKYFFLFIFILFTFPSFAQWQILGQNCQKEINLDLAKQVSNHATSVSVLTKPTVKLAYLIPKNRVAKPYAASNFKYAITQIQKFYQEQMEVNGFDKKTFDLELDAKGDPIVHVVQSQTYDDTYFWPDMWGRSLTEASKLGIGIWRRGEVWVLINECHLMGSDGTISGGTALGGGFGSGDGGGVAMIGSNALALFSDSNLISNKEYAGEKNLDLGEYKLVKDKSFAWFEGTTFSSVSSSYLGALAHELGHAFGLPHDFRNDENFYGNLMGNGLRGIRGNFYPKLYHQNFTRLSYADALILNRSHFFNPASFNQTVAPIEISTIQQQGGLMKIEYKISNPNPLSSIHLKLNGDFIDEKLITGNNLVGFFLTSYLNENNSNNYQLVVYDQQGNNSASSKSITLSSVPDRMATPFVKVSPINRLPNNLQVDYSASNSAEYQRKNLIYTWEQSDDRINFRKFSQSKNIAITDNFDKKFVRLKIKSDKDSVYSTSIFVLSSPFFDRDNDGILDHLDQCLNTTFGAKIDANGCSDSQKDTDKDGLTDDLDDCPLTPNPATPVIVKRNQIELSASNGLTYKWLLDGKELPNATSSSIKAISSGNYSVIAIDAKGCKSNASIAMSVLITENQSDDHRLLIAYPNPVNQKLWIKIPQDFFPNAKIKIFDVIGSQYVQLDSLNDDITLDLHHWPTGVYFLKLTDANESTLKTIKLMKE